MGNKKSTAKKYIHDDNFQREKSKCIYPVKYILTYFIVTSYELIILEKIYDDLAGN